ncbi:MAG: ATP-binding protein [Chromatiaceae bacterium]|nr:MAG: ATP-binding protein [Chromatiaceae bacterium]
MSLLKRPPICPYHGTPLVLSHHGTKSNTGSPLIEVRGAPIRYCPACLAQGRDTSVEAEAAASNAFLRKLERLIESSDFPGELQRPLVQVDFNPRRAEPPGPAGGVIYSAGGQPVAESSEAGESIGSFRPRKPRHSLDQLVLDVDTLGRIREAVNVLLAQDLLFDVWNLAAVARTGRRVALNFYGPPGTGKTLAADAIADLLGREILTISYAELESKYVGETPKNIKAAFASAATSGALLFFDEADSILGKRLTSISQSADNSINVARSTTLIELDNFDGVVIFASNLVKNYDSAFLRRMLAHVAFRLPAAEQRQAIWQCHLPPQLPLAADVDLTELARFSEGAAGGDIQNAVLLAASYASMRSGAERVVALHDLERAISFILDGKRRILDGSE